jgi:hypothetical protein
MAMPVDHLPQGSLFFVLDPDIFTHIYIPKFFRQHTYIVAVYVYIFTLTQ